MDFFDIVAIYCILCWIIGIKYGMSPYEALVLPILMPLFSYVYLMQKIDDYRYPKIQPPGPPKEK